MSFNLFGCYLDICVYILHIFCILEILTVYHLIVQVTEIVSVDAKTISVIK